MGLPDKHEMDMYAEMGINSIPPHKKDFFEASEASEASKLVC